MFFNVKKKKKPFISIIKHKIFLKMKTSNI